MSESTLPEDEKQPNRLQQLMKSKPWLLPVAMVGVGVVVAAVVITTVQANQAREAAEAEDARLAMFDDAVVECISATEARDGALEYLQILDRGETLSIDGWGEDDSYSSAKPEWMQIECILDELDASDSVKQAMLSTRSLDGRQEGSWDGFEADWSYHPDDGLDLIIVHLEPESK